MPFAPAPLGATMVGGRCAVRHPSEQRQKPLGTARGHRRTHDGMHARRPARARARQSSEPAGGHDSALRPRTPALRTSRPRTAPLCHRSALCPAEQCWCGGRAVLVWRPSSAPDFLAVLRIFLSSAGANGPAVRPGRGALHPSSATARVALSQRVGSSELPTLLLPERVPDHFRLSPRSCRYHAVSPRLGPHSC